MVFCINVILHLSHIEYLTYLNVYDVHLTTLVPTENCVQFCWKNTDQ